MSFMLATDLRRIFQQCPFPVTVRLYPMRSGIEFETDCKIEAIESDEHQSCRMFPNCVR